MCGVSTSPAGRRWDAACVTDIQLTTSDTDPYIGIAQDGTVWRYDPPVDDDEPDTVTDGPIPGPPPETVLVDEATGQPMTLEDLTARAQAPRGEIATEEQAVAAASAHLAAQTNGAAGLMPVVTSTHAGLTVAREASAAYTQGVVSGYALDELLLELRLAEQGLKTLIQQATMIGVDLRKAVEQYQERARRL